MEFQPIVLNEEYLMTRIGRLTVNLGAATEQIAARSTYIGQLEAEVRRLTDENAGQQETITALLDAADDEEGED